MSDLADLWRAEMRGNAVAALRSLAIHVVDAESYAVYATMRRDLEAQYGELDAPWPEPGGVRE